MAGIDKTYVSSYEDWKEIIDWAKKTVFTCPNGIEFHVIDWCYNSNSTEDDIREWLNEQKEIPVMNTPQELDYFLIKYCPIKVVQNRMREVYDSEFVESVLNGTSVYDTFVYPEFGKHCKFIKKPIISYNSKWWNNYFKKYYRGFYYVDVILPKKYSAYSSYNQNYDIWLMNNELGYPTSGGSVKFEISSLKSLIRKIRKWRLPIGTKVIFEGQYEGSEGEIIITK